MLNRATAGPLLLITLSWVGSALMPPRASEVPQAAPRSADILRVLTLGHDTAAATLGWASAVAVAVNTPEPAALASATRRTGALDPRWSVPWAYGALWLASLDAIDESESVLDEATTRFPNDPWFPWALGMSRYVHHADNAGAARWLEVAGSRPGAPTLHHEAAKAIRAQRATP